MIGSLRGLVLEISPPHVLLEVQGIGFRVAATPHTLSCLEARAEGFLYIHDHVREDARVLYGFLHQEELALFEKLISISGVGPKVALALLSLGNVDTLKRAIMAGDLATLTSLPGIGKKIAQKIILELKGAIVEEDVASVADREVIDALVSLGYSMSQANTALKQVPVDVDDVSDRVREALRCLSN